MTDSNVAQYVWLVMNEMPPSAQKYGSECWLASKWKERGEHTPGWENIINCFDFELKTHQCKKKSVFLYTIWQQPLLSVDSRVE